MRIWELVSGGNGPASGVFGPPLDCWKWIVVPGISKIMKALQKIGRSQFLHIFLAIERDLIVGGQAVMEGVMMRTPSAYAIACRRQNGEIVTTAERLPKWSDRFSPLGWPILRGGATLIQSMALGIKALNFSAKVFEDDAQKTSGRKTQTSSPEVADLPAAANSSGSVESANCSKSNHHTGAIVSIIFAFVFNIALFIVAPLLITNFVFIYLGFAESPQVAADSTYFAAVKAHLSEIKPHSWIAFNLFDGVLRTLFFLAMLFSLSWIKDIRRVFEYHGAEHKTVFTWENGHPLSPQAAMSQPRRHPRCGTSFLMVVMIVAILLFSIIKFDAAWINLLVRIALMPLVAGISYEIIRYAARKESGSFFRLITAPGIWLQGITTREPDSGQLEVAIRALEESLKLEPAA
ncbi:MAG: DUF1385 domain-containing protein [Blastocatellia bacterium]